MKPKLLLLAGAGIACCLLAAACSKQNDSAQGSGDEASGAGAANVESAGGELAATTTESESAGAGTEEATMPGFPKLDTAPEPAPGTPEAQHAAYVEKRIEELEDLATKDEPSAIQSIVAELSNRDPQIRAAALEAAIQSGDRSVIPKLKEAAAQTDSAEERVAIEEAIEYIELPSLTEVMQRRRAAGITTPPKFVAPNGKTTRPATTRPRTTQ